MLYFVGLNIPWIHEDFEGIYLSIDLEFRFKGVHDFFLSSKSFMKRHEIIVNKLHPDLRGGKSASRSPLKTSVKPTVQLYLFLVDEI